jgi:hypothetical protein
VGVFMDGVSPRTLCVGFPERIHYAFDVQASRLALAWRGRFFNARGTWEGRAGALERPPSDDVLALPRGPALAFLTDGSAPWPLESEARALGRRYDVARVPVLRYALGAVTVEERIAPRLDAHGAWLVRRFELCAAERPAGLWLRALAGAELRELAPRTWSDGALQVELSGDARPRRVGERSELLLAVDFAQRDGLWRAELEVAFTW